jgi:3-hydroxyacyl-CoA dehydrogenase
MDGKAGAGELAQAVRSERRGATLLLIMAHRPVNALSAVLRASLSKALSDLPKDVNAVVICSDINHFSAGADISEVAKALQHPTLAELCSQIENCRVPVIAALHGGVLGGGLELALASHGRVALAAAHLGLPEVSLGTVPVAGATQRLPRLVGAGPALRLMLEAAPMTAVQALSIGLVDQVVDADLRARAVTYANAMSEVLAGRAPIKTSDRRDGLRDGKAYQAAISAARARYAHSPLEAPQRLLECVEAAQILPLEQGLAFEQAAHDDLIHTPQAQGLRHAFYAERRAAFPPKAVAAQGAPQLKVLAIWGAADPVADVAVQALGAGIRVVVIDTERPALVDCLKKIATRQAAAVAEGRMTDAAREADWARLSTSQSPELIVDADMVLANSDAGAVPPTDAPVIVLGPLPLQALPGRVGLTPALAAGLVAELAGGVTANAMVLAAGLSLGRKLGWKVLFTGTGGPIDRRLRTALSAAVARLEAEGITRAAIGAALASYGIGVGARATLPAAPPKAKEVLDACLAALANQGAKLISEKVARRPSDVDAAAVLNGMLPRWMGGPMFQADKRGLLVLRAELIRRSQTAPQIYHPDNLFDRLIAEGRDFAALNRAD